MMNLRLVRDILPIGLVCLAYWLLLGTSHGQEPTTDYSSQETNGDSANAADVSEVREAQPEVYYFRDSEGDLVPVPDITLEDLTRLLALDLGLNRPDRLPRFSLTELSVEGQAEETHAQLTITIRIRTRADGLTRVPLLLPDFVLQESARFDGPAEYYSLDYSPPDGGYVAWIRAAAETDHALTLVGGAPLAQIGQETRLRLNAPRAVSPELSIVLPLESVRAMVVEGAGFLSTSSMAGGKTRLSVQGLRGNVQLSWQPTTSQPARVMDVKGRILVKIMGPDEFQTEARLELKSFGQPIDTFRVRLPAGHSLVSKEVAEYTATTLRQESAEENASEIVEVKLAAKTEGRAVVLLETLLTRPPQDPETPVDVAGFEVLGTLRQSGEIGVSVVGEWSLDWEKGPQVRRVAERDDPIWPDQLDATFEYYRQPCSLRVRVWPLETHISVQPSYILRVDQHQVSMHAMLKYKVQGASASSLRVDMAGWQLQSVESQGRIDRDQLSLARVDPLVIPLADVSPGEFEIELQARREIRGAPDEDQGAEARADLVLNLPQPGATSLAPATVVVVPASNIQLTPRSEEMPFLSPAALPAGLLTPDERAVSLCYLDRGDQGPSQLACDLTILRGTVSVEVRGHMYLAPDAVQVDQTFAFDVLYEPADVLVLSVPRELIERTDWSLLLNGEAVDPRSVRVEPVPGDPARGVALISLAEPQYGKCQLEVRYRLPLPAASGPGEQRRSVPLVMPSQDERGLTSKLEANSIVIHATGATVSLASAGPWTSQDRAADEQLTLVSQSRADRVELNLSPLHAPGPASTVIEMAFVQTWLTSTARQDRAVFRLRTGEDQLWVALPPGVEHDATSVLLNQQQVPAVRTAADRLLVTLPDKEADEYVLELVYPFTTRPPVGAFVVELPTVEGVKWTRQLFWHLVIPAREHLLVGPRGMTPEATWSWKGLYWGRRPLYDQRYLEARVGASPDYQRPSASVNQYLYGSLGSVQRFQARTGMRHLILAVCSGCVLVVGLVLIYVPVFRNPSALLAGCVTLVAFWVLYPTTALMIVQAGGLGLVLVALARLLLWTMGRRYPQRSMVRGRAFPGPDTRSTELVRQPRGEDSGGSASKRGSKVIISTPDVKP